MHLGNYLSLRSYSLPFLKPFLAAKHREAKKNEDRRSKMQLHNPEVAEPNVASQ